MPENSSDSSSLPELASPETLELIIFVGLQASGKSTFYRTHFADSHGLISKDLMRNNKKRARRQQQLLTEALEAGRSVVVDNTNPTVADRARLVAIAQRYNARIIGYWFESEVGACRDRNLQMASISMNCPAGSGEGLGCTGSVTRRLGLIPCLRRGRSQLANASKLMRSY